MRGRIYIKDLSANVGREVTIAGWVDVRRDQGKVVFFDMRDMTGKVQCVILPSHMEQIDETLLRQGFGRSREIRPEWVLKISGIVNKRPEKNINKDMQNGDLELEVTNIEILNKSETPPFEINENTIGVNEDIRMKYK